MMNNKKFNKLLSKVLNHQSNITNEEQYTVLPLQLEFLGKLQNYKSQDEYSSMEQLCIAHCIRYKHYSDMHKETLNNLIKKYSKLVK